MPRSNTHLRSIPNQARSRETFARILQVAAELLQEVGWDGFNTNLLGERVGVRVSAVYRYFPNKEAVVATLAEQLIADWDTWFDHLYEGDEACEDIETAWCESVDLFYESIQKRVGGVAVRHAMKMSPALQEMEQADGEYLVGRLIDSLQRYIPQLKTSDARRAAVLLMASVEPIMDAALQTHSRTGRRLLEEMKKMHVEYLRLLRSS